MNQRILQVLNHPSLTTISHITQETHFHGDLFLVGGAVRDALIGGAAKDDFDLVTRGDALGLAKLLYEAGVCSHFPVTYPRFGTAMVEIGGITIELITARKERYDHDSRKPHVESATYEEDAYRRDFTVNTLRVEIHSGEMVDPTGFGLSDLDAKILRTPLDPNKTFEDDPLRMLRAVRFRWKLGFEPAPDLYESIHRNRNRLGIISKERIRDEFLKMLAAPTASKAMADLMELGLMEYVVPEFAALVGCEQGKYHHLDVWDHTLLVLENAGHQDQTLSLSALLHDIAKPPTRFIDQEGNTRFFGHEAVGETMTHAILRRLKFPEREIDAVAKLVKNHMRLGSSPEFSSSAARRLVRDMGEDLERLLLLVEADTASLRPGLKTLDLEQIRRQLAKISQSTPHQTLNSPLSGKEIMEITGVTPGTEVGTLKTALTEMVLDGTLDPGDREGAIAALQQIWEKQKEG